MSENALQAWAHKRVVPIELESDLTVEFKLPDLGVWLAQGKIPNPLRLMAERLEYGAVDESQLSDEERLTYVDLQAFIIATHLRTPNLLEEVGSLEDAMTWVLDEMPPGHRQRIWMSAFHLLPAGVAESLADLLPFRTEQPSDPTGAPSEGLGTTS